MTMALMFWRLIKMPRVFKNRALNLVYKIFYRKNVRVDWRGVKIINPEGIEIGNDFSAGQGLWLQAVNPNSRLIIGDQVNFSDYVHVGALNKVIISSGCLIGSKVHITDHSHGLTSELNKQADTPPNQRVLYSKGPVIIEKNVWIGDGVVILSGVRIGCGAVVGANSVVTKDVAPFTVVAGVPAKKID
ncbi:acyltransferase [Enterobacter chuandaensis]|uniref:Acyltransferase n=1 Tax=Enterobacter chuandaensis TaxID=2497875 RepID=A0AA96M0V3_9ENTR|nr:acyltransferase [Enterobacter chuandaensis]WNS36498.1 acyltransferase [Enterobacter chuandaensis]